MKGKTNTEVVISKTENLAAGTEVEIVDVCHGCETYYMCVIPSGVQMTIDARFVDIIDYTPSIDWEQRRYELAKVAMQALTSNSFWMKNLGVCLDESSNRNIDAIEIVSIESINYADAMIKKLKGE